MEWQATEDSVTSMQNTDSPGSANTSQESAEQEKSWLEEKNAHVQNVHDAIMK